MFLSLREVFSEQKKTFLIGICFEEGSWDDKYAYEKKRKGWSIPYFEGDISDIKELFQHYKLVPRLNNDSRIYWENEEPVEDQVLNMSTYYRMYLKNLDGSDVSKSEFSEINDLLLMTEEYLDDI